MSIKERPKATTEYKVYCDECQKPHGQWGTYTEVVAAATASGWFCCGHVWLCVKCFDSGRRTVPTCRMD